MRILFVNFNLNATAGINNGIAVLSSLLKRRGFQVELLFLCEQMGYPFDLARIKKDILRLKPQIIGLSLIETQLKYADAFCRDLRSYYRGFVVCGGSLATMDPQGCLALEAVDAVCVGEGEGAMLELAEALRKRTDPSGIRNLWSKRPDGSILKNPLRPFADIDRLPLEDKELFNLDKLLPLKNNQLEVLVGRGCAYRCSYCINDSYMRRYQSLCESRVTLKDYLRLKKPQTVVREIQQTRRLHPRIRKIAFIDDNFVTNNAFLSDFCARYRRSVRLPFMVNANPLSYTAQKAALLKGAGCVDVRFGVESGSERLKRDILKRPIPNATVEEAFAINKELGMMTSSFNMIGLPTETRQEVLMTLRLNALIQPDTVKLMTFYPFKNTPIHELCEELKLIDWRRKRELDNYDTFTCLRFPAQQRLFLEKIQAAFGWYLNAFLDSPASGVYRTEVKRIEGMTRSEWARFDFARRDRQLSLQMRARKYAHYAQFLNRSLAVRYPSPHTLTREEPHGS